MFAEIISTGKTKAIIILGIILVIGVFLRAYRFDDLQRFNQDQARDAAVVEQMAKDHNFLIMGPYASGTDFHLGPGYYYLEYASMLIFGNSPASMAYPTLLFSVLAIPLLYVLLRKLFSENISLAVAALYAVSFYAVKYARFAWNPNPLPFFVLAFILLLAKMNEEKKVPKIIWPVLLGTVIGIGVQLHTFMIVIFPLFALSYFAYFIWKKYPLKKSLIIVVFVAVLLNVPQIIQEVRTGWKNTQAFVEGTGQKTQKHSLSLAERSAKAVECYAQGNSYMLSARNAGSECVLFERGKDSAWLFYGNIALSLAFMLGGLAIVVHQLKKETETERKRFLLLVLSFTALCLLAFVPAINMFNIRYMGIVFFLPFLLLGFWIKLFVDNLKIFGLTFSSLAVLALAYSNIVPIRKTYFSGANPDRAETDYGGIDLEDAWLVSDFILSEAGKYEDRKMYISASEKKYLVAAQYFLDKHPEFGIGKLPSKNVSGDKHIVFSVNENFKGKKIKYDTDGYSLIDSTNIDGYDIYILEKKD
ncbi:MAG: phospholipid carrier-dependent glycosyltransferase [Candidatus Moranbacteria bacterium]|nr:phospholipid carrier-dependent glycosyltransferase [Candidatus Moranbacteria bacterium]